MSERESKIQTDTHPQNEIELCVEDDTVYHQNDQGVIVDAEGNIIEEIVEDVDDVIGDRMMNHAVSMQYMEDVDEEDVIIEQDGGVLLEEDATQSLVALSQGSDSKHLSGRMAPRILRRQAMGERFYNQSSSQAPEQHRQILRKSTFPIISSLPTKPLLPVAIRERRAQQGHVQDRTNGKDWREEQKKMLEVYEIYDNLPDHLKEPFRDLIDRKELSIKIPKKSVGYKQSSDANYPIRQLSRYHVESRELVDGQTVVDEMVNSKLENSNLDPRELEDMPQLELEEAPNNSSCSQGQVETTIDVEGYDSSDDQDLQYVDNAEISNYNYVQQHDVDERGNSNMNLMDLFKNDTHVSSQLGQFCAEGDQGQSQLSIRAMMLKNDKKVQDPGYPDMRFCPGCKINVKRTVYYHHSRMIKKYGICNMFTPKRFPCGVEGCDEKLGTIEKLCEHMFQIHGAPTDIKKEVFAGEPEFEHFLRDLESKGGNFRMSRGNKLLRAGLVQYFRCNRTVSVPKSKTLRNCDEVGLYGEMVGDGGEGKKDPFLMTSAQAGGKPALRTEDSCTAFYRKAYLQNGMIEVRYCDYHLHSDERLRLPTIVRQRVKEMFEKGLPAPVILMVLQYERDKFCALGSPVEKRVLGLTPRDITNMYHNFSKSRKDLEVDFVQGRHKHDGRTGNDGSTLSSVNRTSLAPVELQMLELFERNQNVVFADIQKIKQVDNRKRQCRESIRNNVYDLGRFIRTTVFAEMSIDHLERIASLLIAAVDTTKEKCRPDLFPLAVVNRNADSEAKPETTSYHTSRASHCQRDQNVAIEQLEHGDEHQRPILARKKRYDRISTHVMGSKRARVADERNEFLDEENTTDLRTPNTEITTVGKEDMVDICVDDNESLQEECCPSYSEMRLEERIPPVNKVVDSGDGNIEISIKKEKASGIRGKRRKAVEIVNEEEKPTLIEQQQTENDANIFRLPERTRTGRVIRRKVRVDM